MRGAWRPWLSFGALPVVVFAGLAAVHGPLPPGAYVAVSFAMLPLVALVALLGVVRGGRFVRGLRDAGEVVDVERDEVDWGGDRTTVVRGLHGTWIVHAVTGKHSRVEVQGPGDEVPWLAKGDERKAAREAVDRVLGSGRAEPPPRLVTPARLLLYVAGFYGMLVFIAAALGGARAASWGAALLAPVFVWLAWRVVRRGRGVLQDTRGGVIDP